MTDATNFGISNHHFEAAGIPIEDEKKNETGIEAGVDEATITDEPKTAESSEERKTAEGDSNVSGTDSKSEPKPEEKEQVVNRPEPELDQEQYSELVNGKPVRPEVAGRWYHQRNTARQERDVVNAKYGEAATKVTQLEAQIEVYKTASAVVGELQPAEVPRAVRLYTQLQKNPVATLKQMLVEAKANGHNVEGIGEGIDTAAIQRMLDQRLAGLEGKKEPPVVNQQPATVDNDDDLFVKQYPDAQHHMDVYLDMLKKNPQLTNTELYFTVKNWSDSNGYDYSKPLKPQIEARNKPQPKVETKDTTPRLNGNGIVNPEPLISTGGKEESFKEIIQRALQENPRN